jgi:hypothetical protein
MHADLIDALSVVCSVVEALLAHALQYLRAKALDFVVQCIEEIVCVLLRN